jgi:hypothetical protein
MLNKYRSMEMVILLSAFGAFLNCEHGTSGVSKILTPTFAMYCFRAFELPLFPKTLQINTGNL